MLTDWELWACANHYVSRHGEDAPIIAAMRVEELLAAGDLDGSKSFRAIVHRIEQLLEGGQRTHKSSGAPDQRHPSSRRSKGPGSATDEAAG